MTVRGRVARQRRKSAWAIVAVAGGFAGTVSVAVQLLAWWSQAADPLEQLLRDARLTAALVMGKKILATSLQWRWAVFVSATLIHFALSMVYAALALPFVQRLSVFAALLAGAVYGLLIYAVNLHGFTLLFPWFSVARGVDTIIVHVAFGIAVTAAYCVLLPIEKQSLPSA
jgi:hypothetical protein